MAGRTGRARVRARPSGRSRRRNQAKWRLSPSHTHIHVRRHRLIFDFDDTLASDSTSGFLGSIGVDTASFWKDQVDPLLTHHDWDPVPAYLYKMIQLSQTGQHGPITQQRLRDWGARLELHEGVSTLFPRLRAAVRAEHPQVQLEFYLISSGIGDVVRSTPIAHEFTEIWASEFTYGADGGIEFPRRIVSFTDKTRYLFHIQKGIIGREFRNKPFEVNRKVPRTACACHLTRWSSSAMATPTFRASR